MAQFGKLIILLAVIFLKCNFGFDTGPIVYRKVVCKEGRFDFKNVQCKHEDSEQPQLALRRVMFGYLNESVNCTESEDTIGCEEPMSATQMTLMLQKGSAQPSLSAIQFPAVDVPKYCKDFGESPDYMAFTFECLQMSNIIEMCSSESKTGPRLSVYNPGYPGSGHVPSGAHRCICTITSPAPLIVFTLYDHRLNCTGNNQNLTVSDDNGRVLGPVCDSLESGQRNSSSKNLTLVWEGQKYMAGLFWIGFQAGDPDYNVSADCFPIWDPTTTTTTTTTTTITITTTTSKTPETLLASSMTTGHTPAVSTDHVQVTSKTTQNSKHPERQRTPVPKTLIYSLVGAGAVILLIIVVICRVALKRRNDVEVIDVTRMDYIARNNSTDSKESRRSREVQSGDSKPPKQISGKARQAGEDRGRRRSSASTSDTLDEIATFEKVNNGQIASANAGARSSKPDIRRQSAT